MNIWLRYFILAIRKMHYFVFFLAILSPIVSYLRFKIAPRMRGAGDFLLEKKDVALFFFWCLGYVLFVFFNRSLHFSYMERNIMAAFFAGLGFLMFVWRLRVPQKSLMQIWTEAGGIWAYQSIAGAVLFFVLRSIHINPDAQKLAQRFHEVALSNFAMGSVIRTPNLIAEEFLCCFLFAVLFSLFRKKIWSAVGGAVVFGLLHISAWNFQTAAQIILTRLVVEGCWLVLLDIRPFIVFHIANNLISSSVILGRYTLLVRTLIMIIFLAPFCYEMISRIFRKKA